MNSTNGPKMFSDFINNNSIRFLQFVHQFRGAKRKLHHIFRQKRLNVVHRVKKRVQKPDQIVPSAASSQGIGDSARPKL